MKRYTLLGSLQECRQNQSDCIAIIISTLYSYITVYCHMTSSNSIVVLCSKSRIEEYWKLEWRTLEALSVAK